MIYTLLIILIIVFCLVLFFDRDIFSPAALICESYLLALVCAIMNIFLWNINLSFSTMQIILIGVFSFVIPSWFLLRFNNKNNGFQYNKNIIIKDKHFNIRKGIYIFFIFLQAIVIVLYFYYVIKTIGGVGNVFNFSKIMNEYREGTSYGDLDSLVPTYVNQLVKVSQIIAYISMYNILYQKIVLIKKNKLFAFNIISIILYIVLTLLSGGRYKMISFIIGTLIMWNIISRKVNNKKFNFKYTLKIVIIIFASLLVFSQTRTLVGRTNDSSFISYISSYFGGSIELLDLYMRNPIRETKIIGKESFYALNSTLSKLGIVEQYRMHLEFRSSNGIVIGNVYTALRCFYHDFGMMGVISLQLLLSIIWTCWYKRIKRNNCIYKFDSSMLFYCMFINCLFLNSYRDNFFSSTVSLSTITMIIYFIVIKKLLINEEDLECLGV